MNDIQNAIEIAINAIILEPEETLRTIGTTKSVELIKKLSDLSPELAEELRKTRFVQMLNTGTKFVSGSIIPGGAEND